MKNTKRLLIAILSLMLILSFSPLKAVYSNPNDAISPIIEVTIPEYIEFTIDPFEINKRGQIYSNSYNIENFGETDIMLNFSDISIVFADSDNFEPLASPFDDTIQTDAKAIYLQLNFGRDNINPIVLTDFFNQGDTTVLLRAPDYNMPIDESVVTIDFVGSVNHLPKTQWHKGDVRLMLTYSLEPIMPEFDPEFYEIEEIIEDRTDILDEEYIDKDSLFPEDTYEPEITPDEPEETEKPEGAPDEPEETEKPEGTPNEPEETEKPEGTPDEPEETEKPEGTPDEPEETDEPETN